MTNWFFSNVQRTAERRASCSEPVNARSDTRTAPYMHDGSIGTLSEVVDFYDRGGNANPDLDGEVHVLWLTDAEKKALLAFLDTLKGSR